MKRRIDNKNLYVEQVSGCEVYYSYETPIIVVCPAGVFATKQEYSVTTTRHQNYILSQYPTFELVDQDELETLIYE